MTDETVSVVIPCFNAGSYLAEALDSVFAQRHGRLEVVVVDDGSTDHSATVAESYADRIVYLYQENQGISGARNTGLQAASGTLIAFLDADDIWPAESLAARLAALRANPDAGCIYGAVEQFISPEIPVAQRGDIYCPPSAQTGRLAGSMLLTRHAFETVGLFDPAYGIGETMDWVSRSNASGIESVGIDTVVLRRRIHSSNSVRESGAQQGDYLRVLKASIARRRQDTRQ
jgi:glycosyltransferase involved in cell wall biosynthesis